MQLSSSRIERLRPFLPGVISCAALILAAWSYTSNLSSVVDVALYDESNYLDWGRHIPSRGLPAPTFGPLYAAWYFCLAFFQPDTLDLYYLNARLLTFLLAAALYVALRSLNVRPVLALFASCAILYSRGNIVVLPKVSHLAHASRPRW